MGKIDLNCDLGESFGIYKLGIDEEILNYITSANIACGFHAGDPNVMRKTVASALEKGVNVGAHPGFQDLVGFGRREIEITATEVYNLVVYQIGALQAIVKVEGGVLHHVKPHGALYNMAARDPVLAKAIVKAIKDVDAALILYGLANSQLTKAGEALGLQVYHEVFADRTYQADGTLTPRTAKNAIITNENEAIKQISTMIRDGAVQSLQGVKVPIKPDTICIHGDNHHALAFAKKISSVLI
ncbi:LamB/YcsF family protein [Anaerobacillus sp. CMMVII]|uniref:5-oxoprolinase subunit PxpA n=1 Tax=Anaerobacillus sp. CMMVII TaxID=2755588 RepID=UPI0021B7DF48|nr:5-oxoprolinase subunit PxpA [Anaerobacillus sp. CMMVII]MCT8138164.1 LamB/YcsF family protein [Anaerobacillus sp. CMMVII]